MWNDPDTQATQTATGLIASVYSITITDDNGCIATDSIEITEPSILTATIAIVSNVSCKGINDGEVVVSVTGGTPQYTYLWDNDSTQTSDTASALYAGIHSVLITDTMGCDTTISDTVTEPGILVAIIDSTINVSCKGDSTGAAVISVTGGTSPYTYMWDDPNIQTNSQATSLPAGTYNVTVTDTLGCDTTISVNITEPDSLILNITGVTDVNCFGDSTGTATANVSGGTVPYTYLWDVPDTALQGNSTVTGLPAGSYTALVIDSLGCTSNDSVSITQQPDIILTTAPDTLICIGMYAVISASASGGAGGYSYSWNDSSVTGAGQDTLYPVTPTTYIVTVTDSLNCSKTDSMTVTVLPLIIVFSVPDSVCVGDSTTIMATVTGGDGSYNYLWETGDTSSYIMVTPATTTYYTLTVNDACGTPTVVDSVLVEVNPYPEVGVSPLSASACGSANIIFFDQIENPPGSYYYWDFGDGSMDTTTIPYAQHLYDTSGIFYMSVSVMSLKGCQTDSFNVSMIIISPDPIADFTAALSDTSILLPTIDFTDLSTGDPVIGDTISTWVWDFGDGSTSTDQHPAHTYSDTGTYTVQLAITNQYGCPDTIVKTIITCSNRSSSADTIVISPMPLADFIAEPATADFNAEPYITTILFPGFNYTDLSASGDTGVGDTISTWFWDFGDGASSVAQDPMHSYAYIGTYQVQLTVMNEYGCPATVVKPVKVIPEFRIWIPSSFSPNGDGVNDIFTAKGIFISTFEMYIYDRWGNEIFDTSNINIPWDGTANEGTEIAQQDVYVYLINITNIYGEELEYIGSVTLVK